LELIVAYLLSICVFIEELRYG